MSSVRARLTVLYSVVLAICLAAFSVAIWFTLRQRLLDAVDAQLKDRVSGLERFLRSEITTADAELVRLEAREYASSLSSVQTIRIWNGDGQLVFAMPDVRPYEEVYREGGFAEWHDGRQTMRRFRREVAFENKIYELELGTSLHDVETTLNGLRAALFGCIPIVVLLSSGAGWFLSRKALAPVDAMTSEANALSFHNLNARLRVPQTGDELARLAESWNGVLSRLQGAAERLIRFTGDASHELRTPVTLIRTTAEVALRHPRSEAEYRDVLLQIARETERMSELIEDLLTLARSDAGEVQRGGEVLDMRSVVKAACISLEWLAEQADVRLSCPVSETPVEVRGDGSALRRLIQLILENGIRYTPRGGLVEVWSGTEDSIAVVIIRDTGTGIAPEDLPHIFDRFWRADKARTAGSGTGLGLSIAEAIAAAHGGHIQVESVNNRGTQVRICLPLVLEQAEKNEVVGSQVS